MNGDVEPSLENGFSYEINVKKENVAYSTLFEQVVEVGIPCQGVFSLRQRIDGQRTMDLNVGAHSKNRVIIPGQLHTFCSADAVQDWVHDGLPLAVFTRKHELDKVGVVFVPQCLGALTEVGNRHR